MRLVRLALALALTGPAAVLVLAPQAEAQLQDIVFELTCQEGPATIQPLGAPGVWPCTARLEYTSARTGLTDPTQPGIVDLVFVDPPPWMNPTASPSTIASMGPGYGNEVIEFPVLITVGLTKDAPAFETTQLAIEVEVVQHPRDEGDLSEFTILSGDNLAVTPGYFGLYDIRLSPPFVKARPQEIAPYTIEIDNFSNGPTRFEFSLVTEEVQGFNPVPPGPVVVPGAAPSSPAAQADGNATGDADAGDVSAGPAHASVPFQVQAAYWNGYLDHKTPIALRVDTSYALDPGLRGPSSQLTMLTHSKGFYAPGPEAPLVVLGLLLLGGLTARQRRA